MRLLLERIAYWMYTESLNEIGVVEEDLLNRVVEELLDLQFENLDEAQTLGESWINHCRDRAWLFSDVGKSDLHSRRFAFTHRTFLEYFTAGHIVQNNPDTKSLEAALSSWVLERRGDLVAQLALQAAPRVADSVALHLLARCRDEPRTHQSILGFLATATRNVEFHERVVTSIARDVLLLQWKQDARIVDGRSNLCTARLFMDREGATSQDTAKLFEEVIEGLSYETLARRRQGADGVREVMGSECAQSLYRMLGCRAENTVSFARALVGLSEGEELIPALWDPAWDPRAAAVIFFLGHQAFSGSILARHPNSRLAAAVRDASSSVSRRCSGLSESSFEAGFSLVSWGLVAADEFSRRYGASELLRRTDGPSFSTRSPLGRYLFESLRERELSPISRTTAQLIEPALDRRRFPLFSGDRLKPVRDQLVDEVLREPAVLQRAFPPAHNVSLRVAVVVFATAAEALAGRGEDAESELARWVRYFRARLMSARNSEESVRAWADPGRVLDAMEANEKETVELIDDWSAGRVRFTDWS